MARTDEQALLLQVSADIKGLEKAFDRALTKVKTNSKQMEQSASNLEKFFGKPSLVKALDKTFDATRFKILDSGAARVGLFGSALQSLGPGGLIAAAGIGAFTAALVGARDAAKFADDIADTANRLHITTDALQEYRYAIIRAGGEEKGADEALEAFSITLGKAQEGLGKAKKGFLALGFTEAQIKSFKTVEEGLNAVTEKIGGLGSNVQKDAVIDQLGLNGLKPLIQGGIDSMRTLQKEAHTVGYVMDQELIARGGEMNDQFQIMSKVIDIQLKSALVDLGPIILEMTQELIGMLRAMGDIIDAFRQIENRRSSALRNVISDSNATITELGLRQMAGQSLNVLDTARLAKARENSERAQKELDSRAVSNVGGGITTGASLRDFSAGGSGRTRKSKAERPEQIKAAYVFDQEMFDLLEALDYWKEVEANGNKLKPFDASISDLTSTGDMQQQLADTMDAARQSTHDAIYDGVAGGLEAGFHGGVPEMVEYLKDQVVRSLMSAIAESITTSLMAKSGGGGFIGTALSLFGFAGGTNYAPGGLAVVGEKGPEIVNLPRGSQVVPNNIASTINQVGQARMQGSTVVQHFHLDASGAVMTEDLIRYINQTGAQAAAAGARQGSTMAVSQIYGRARNKLGR